MRKHPETTTATPPRAASPLARDGVREQAGQILVVLDSAKSLKLISSLLGAEYQIDGASSGEEALRVLEEDSRRASREAFDVVILSASMPDMNGFDVCKRLRENRGTEHLPIAILTSVDSLQEKVRAIEAGADDLLSDPIDQFELRARIRSLMRVSRLRRQLDEIRRSHEMCGSETDLSAEKASFARMVAHDLRGPLAGIIGNAQLLGAKAESLAPDLMRLTQRVLDSARQMQNRLADVTDICLFEESKRPLHLDKTDVRAAAAMVIEEYRPLAHSCEVELELEPSGSDPEDGADTAIVDAQVLLRILGNLVATSLKHTPPGGTVRVAIGGRQPGKMVIHVADTGDVISHEIRNAVFEPGVRAAPSPPRDSPFGKTVALSFCRMAVDAHGGRLWLEQNAAGGNTFGFLLPMEPAAK